MTQWQKTLVQYLACRAKLLVADSDEITDIMQTEQGSLPVVEACSRLRRRLQEHDMQPVRGRLDVLELGVERLAAREITVRVKVREWHMYAWEERTGEQEKVRDARITLICQEDGSWGVAADEVVRVLPSREIEELPVAWTSEEEERAVAEKPSQTYVYDRIAAVRYAELWWNSYNPAYRHFDDDCTNYISQCLHAGGIPMKSTGNRATGWWYRGGNSPGAVWSYSWAVANSFRWMLERGNPIYTEKKESPYELTIGDIICYDFEGDGRWNHSTIIVAKDFFGSPLVNAHTVNSRLRYWDYTDSTAYTKDIKYSFYHIL
ncbi:putative amidase-like protein [Aneurinibacillus soli]|uniref:Putative amidase domain protein n=1 Tax=Aneurinibacillus soli TaxID=1500254 RepID=A0A0U5B5F8_9BACL|nr:amidase domain-containing protein [Aneurinibacillus soli]PYE58624.1 putative amidase-like protein [Aneurinibacillus soli]BAU29616.1 putative amidase domain protein [Aneurinibacillus soli]